MTTASPHTVIGFIRHLASPDECGQTDHQLLGRFTLQQDEAAFAELVRRHGPMVLSACRRVLSHQQDAEDAFQAAFLVLARKAGAIRQGDSVAGWLHRVSCRLAVRARTVRGRYQQPLTPLTDEVAARRTDLPPDSLAAFLDEEVQRLPEHYRSAVVLCYLESRSQAEAAHLLATTEDAVNSRLKRARELLRQRLTRRGFTLSSVAAAEALTASAAQAALPPAVVRLTTRTALLFAASQGAVCTASAFAVSLARGALDSMFTLKSKVLSALALPLIAALVATTTLLLAAFAQSDSPPGRPARPPARRDTPPKGAAKAKPKPSCIVLWMSGGPSQIDTFDPKPGHANGNLVGAIDTTIKDVQISKHLPELAKLTNHLTIIRSLSHREGDHARATYLMHTGHADDGLTDYPALGSVLAKELGDGRPGLPRYFRIVPPPFLAPPGSGFLGAPYAPIVVKSSELDLPSADEFDKAAKGQGEKMKKAVEKAFDLDKEKASVRDAYGRGAFGQGCLLARRLVEVEVPVVEVTLPGWDTHANAAGMVPRLSEELDAALSALLRDLHGRKRLETTLIVVMGEFGRTPRINANGGRDHYPMCCSVVLAGGRIKGGQVIGETSDDGVKVEKRPVTPQELLATVYQALGIDPARKLRMPGGREVPLVEKGIRAVKEALR